MEDIPDLDIDMIERFNLPIPRYTSYPTVPVWNGKYTSEDHARTLTDVADDASDLSLYIHLPFCERRCSFCGCNTYITRRESHFRSYLNHLKEEIENVVEYIGDGRKYSQFHIGGGTPSYFPAELLHELLEFVDSKFTPTSDAEKSVEMHPSVTTDDRTLTFLNHGFNRFSMGVQDFDPLVQKKINRHQTFEETKYLIEFSRDHGIESINLDLIYGLPFQSKKGFSQSLDLIHELRPERLAVYSYAHLPKIFRHQGIFPLEVLPRGTNKLELFLLAREKLLEFGYLPIGFDHFALKDDELWTAYTSNDLNRNFMGYTTHAGSDLIAFGFSAISDVNGAYSQNHKTLDKYYAGVWNDKFPILKGLRLNESDLMRKEAIVRWLCQFYVDPEEIMNKYGTSADSLIKDINDGFPQYEKEGLVYRDGEVWRATALGKVFARLPASVMDEYLNSKNRGGFSKSI